ncbi:MAG: hypothetical protein HYS12_27835 [Planctomycetes bacterium]|nr:hypothetical protein [Planctomycetota bacterium]
MASRRIVAAKGTAGDFGISIESDFRGGISFYFFERRNGKTFLAKPMEMVFKEVKEGEYSAGPTLRLDYLFGDAFLQAMAEALDDANVKTDSDAKIQGTLDATRYHLEDLRSLLNLKKT